MVLILVCSVASTVLNIHLFLFQMYAVLLSPNRFWIGRFLSQTVSNSSVDAFGCSGELVCFFQRCAFIFWCLSGAQTSYKAVTGLMLEDVLSKDRSRFPDEFAEGAFCQDYVARCSAAARTWSRPHPQDNLMYD